MPMYRFKESDNASQIEISSANEIDKILDLSPEEAVKFTSSYLESNNIKTPKDFAKVLKSEIKKESLESQKDPIVNRETLQIVNNKKDFLTSFSNKVKNSFKNPLAVGLSSLSGFIYATSPGVATTTMSFLMGTIGSILLGGMGVIAGIASLVASVYTGNMVLSIKIALMVGCGLLAALIIRAIYRHYCSNKMQSENFMSLIENDLYYLQKCNLVEGFGIGTAMTKISNMYKDSKVKLEQINEVFKSTDSRFKMYLKPILILLSIGVACLTGAIYLVNRTVVA